jgi:hypothetical protein
LYDGGVGNCQPYDIVDFGTTGLFGETTYPMLGHFNDPLFPTFDINFSTNDFYFYEVGALTNNNLYNLYWRRTVNQINVGKMLIAYFDLNELDIQTLKLNDKIYIDNSWWNINKIADYNANNNQLTKVELISVDTEIDLAPFRRGNGRPIGIGVIDRGLIETLRSNNATNNVIIPGADVIIQGRGNVATAGARGIIIGDGQTLSEDGMVVSNLTVTGTFNGEVQVPYLKYVALISQTGLLDPTVVVLENTIGDIVWTRIGLGGYLGTLAGAFFIKNTYVIGGSADISAGSGDFATLDIKRSSNDTIQLFTYDNFTGSDDMLFNTTIEIRTY